MAALHVSAGYFITRLLYGCTTCISRMFYNKVALWLHYMYQRDILKQGCSMAVLHISAGYFITRLFYGCTTCISGIFYNKVALWLYYMYQRDIL